MPVLEEMHMKFAKNALYIFQMWKNFKKFSEEISQLVFLKNETVLDDNEREIIKTFYLNNEKVF